MTKTIKKQISIALSLCLLLTNIASGATQKISNNRKLEYIKEGRILIDNFFDPSNIMYFGKKVDAFFTDENLQKIDFRIKEESKATGISTEDIRTEIMSEEFTKMVFHDLTGKLSNIQNNYKNKTELKISLQNASKIEIVVVSATGLLGTLGISAAVLGMWGAMTASTASLWAALTIWWAGPVIVGKAALTAIYAGPWGWIALGGIGASATIGYLYHQKEKERIKKQMIEDTKRAVETQRSIIKTNWNNSFNNI